MSQPEQKQEQSEKTVTVQLSPEAEEQYSWITRNLQEVTSADVLRKVLAEGRTPKAYWGTAPTGRPHIAYCVPMLKIADFLTAGVHVKILLADMHAFLDASKSSLEVVQWRTKYYSFLVKALLTALGVSLEKLEFVVGSSYQLKADYTLDVYKFHSLTSITAAEHAGADVVKQSEAPLITSMLYPGLQALDEQYLDVDFQFGGVDQRKIFMYAAEFLPKLGYAKRAHLMNAMVPGLSGGKMSASDPKSKIDFLDSPADIKNKLKGALCAPGEVENNGVLAFVKTVLIPIQELREQQAKLRGEAGYTGADSFAKAGAPLGTVFTVSRPDKFGGDIHFSDYPSLEAAYVKEEIHPGDIKGAVTQCLVSFLGSIQKAYAESPEWQEADLKGYPSLAPAPAKAHTRADKKKDARSKPPTEEERAALRAAKEKEKAAKVGAAGAVGAVAAGVSNKVVSSTDLPKLKLLAKGKVRDIYALPDAADSDKLLFVATDRISAFDVIMENGIPQKGVTLTTLSLFWFHKLAHVIPNHVLAPSIQSASPKCLADPTSAWDEFPRSLDEYRDQLEGRSMIVKKCEVVKIEAIVRGYITGSAWAEYQKSQTVHGIQMPAGLVESQKLPTPIFTPSTKADQGEHDENIHPDKAKDICGAEVAEQIEKTAIRLYTEAAAYALERGLILADTKFEFGLLDTPNGKQLILIDELLTPDSSRYWGADAYVEGKSQPSFDKQYLRDWLIKSGVRGKPGVSLPEDVVRETRSKYEEAKDRVMGLGAFKRV